MKFDVPENFKPTRFNEIYLTHICIAMLTLVTVSMLSINKVVGIQLSSFSSFAFFAAVLVITGLIANEMHYRAQINNGSLYELAFAPKLTIEAEKSTLKNTTWLIFLLLILWMLDVIELSSESLINYCILALLGCTILVYVLALGMAFFRNKAYIQAQNPEGRPIPLTSPLLLFEVGSYLLIVAFCIWNLGIYYVKPQDVSLNLCSYVAFVAMLIIVCGFLIAFYHANTINDDAAHKLLKDTNKMKTLKKQTLLGLILAVVGLYLPTLHAFQYTLMGWLMSFVLITAIIVMIALLRQVPRYIRRIDEEKQKIKKGLFDDVS